MRVADINKPVSRSVLQEMQTCRKEHPAPVGSAPPDRKGATLPPAYVATQGLVPGRLTSGSAHGLSGIIFFMKRWFADC